MLMHIFHSNPQQLIIDSQRGPQELTSKPHFQRVPACIKQLEQAVGFPLH